MHTKVTTFAAAASVIVALVAVAVALTAASPTEAGTFLIRGDVVKLDKPNGTVHVYIRHTNATAGKYAGQVREINAKNAKFYKYDAKQRKVRATYGSTLDNLGYEVVIRGSVNSSDSFTANWVVRNDNRVRLRGLVRGHDKANNYLDIELDTVQYQATHKTYKIKTFPKGERVRIYYNDERITFVSRDGNTMQEDEVTNNDEKVTVENLDVRYGSRFVTDHTSIITDGKWKF